MQRFRLCPGRRSDAGVAPTLMVLLTAATLLAACGGAPNPPSTGRARRLAPAPPALSRSGTPSPSPASQSTMPALLARFHAAHPDLTVEYKAIAPATAGAEFAAAVARIRRAPTCCWPTRPRRRVWPRKVCSNRWTAPNS